jgi:hypothetical protein
MTLSQAEYIDVQVEGIKVWERKYTISEGTSGQEQINLDGPGDNLQYHLDLTNAGVYYPFKGTRAVSNPEETIVARDKMRSVYASTYHREVENIEISYNTLHQVELEEQEAQYMEAQDMDESDGTLIWSAEMPPRFEGFLNKFGFPRFYFRPAQFQSEKLKWEDHERFKLFKQYDFWRPGGHQYTWSTRVRWEKCMLFGVPDIVHDGYYSHVDHYGVGTPLEIDPSKPIDPGNSYYSLRFYVQQAKYNRFLLLSGIPPEGGYDLVSSANIYNPSSPF